MHNLIEDHLGYAHAIAAAISKKYSRLDRRDLESSAELGLVQAARDYDPSRGVSFATYAYYRIRGAIFDELRQVCQTNKFETAANDCMMDYTATVSAKSRKKMAGNELESLTSHLVTTYLLSFEALPQDRPSPNLESPVDQLMLQEQCDRLRQAVGQLPDRYRRILELYYYRDLSLKEIGNHLGLSESWISRLHATGVSLLRDVFQRHSSSSKKTTITGSNHKAFPLKKNKSYDSQSITGKQHYGSYNSKCLSTTGQP
jgi:RNA polymerase sigma factor for flagellar operon FliA